MRIKINDNYEIMGYALVGGFDGGIEIDDSIVPQGFISYFKPARYLYKEGTIELNNDFEEENETNLPSTPPTIVTPSTDEELRVMFATMQVQLVQANLMVAELSQQNSELAQEIVKINEEIKNIKEGDNNEDVIS